MGELEGGSPKKTSEIQLAHGGSLVVDEQAARSLNQWVTAPAQAEEGCIDSLLDSLRRLPSVEVASKEPAVSKFKNSLRTSSGFKSAVACLAQATKGIPKSEIDAISDALYSVIEIDESIALLPSDAKIQNKVLTLLSLIGYREDCKEADTEKAEIYDRLISVSLTTLQYLFTDASSGEISISDKIATALSRYNDNLPLNIVQSVHKIAFSIESRVKNAKFLTNKVHHAFGIYCDPSESQHEDMPDLKYLAEAIHPKTPELHSAWKTAASHVVEASRASNVIVYAGDYRLLSEAEHGSLPAQAEFTLASIKGVGTGSMARQVVFMRTRKVLSELNGWCDSSNHQFNNHERMKRTNSFLQAKNRQTKGELLSALEIEGVLPASVEQTLEYLVRLQNQFLDLTHPVILAEDEEGSIGKIESMISGLEESEKGLAIFNPPLDGGKFKSLKGENPAVFYCQTLSATQDLTKINAKRLLTYQTHVLASKEGTSWGLHNSVAIKPTRAILQNLAELAKGIDPELLLRRPFSIASLSSQTDIDLALKESPDCYVVCKS